MPEKYCRNCYWIIYDEDYELNRCHITNELITDLCSTCNKWEYYQKNRRSIKSNDNTE